VSIVALATCVVASAVSVGAAGAAAPGIDAAYGEGGVLRLNSLMPAGYVAVPNSEASVLGGTNGSALAISPLTSCASPYESGACRVSSAVRRITPAGSLDGTYGEGGLLRLPDADGFAAATQADPRGRLLTAQAGQGVVQVRRFTPRGRPDGSFGRSGVVSLAGFEGNARATAILIAPRGRLLVAVAEAAEREGVQAGIRVTLVRLLSDGRVDHTYGKAGKAVLGIQSSFGVTAYSTSTGAAFVVARNCCSSDSFTPVHRVTSAGKVDVSFNREERKAQVKALADFPETRVEAVVAGRGGTVELLGSSSGFGPGPGFALRLTAKGRADGKFGDGGLIKLTNGIISAGPGSNGSTLAVLEAFPPNTQGQSRVVRLLADGTPAPSFGGEAGISLPEAGSAEFVSSAGGRVLLAGVGQAECQTSCQPVPYLTKLIEPSGAAGAGKGGKR
jgi:uncharacterized delta-60 repeat protein